MSRVSLDTSFLITFADPGRPNHSIAVKYFRYCIKEQIDMFLSVLAAGEFEVRQSVDDLPLKHFSVLNYNLLHARLAARFHTLLEPTRVKGEIGERKIIYNDVKIIAQAHEEDIQFILTEDKKTLRKMTERLSECNAANVKAVILEDGFKPNSLSMDPQGDLFEP